ncbi:MAG: alpha/beta hydrolase-fold protein [Daejeonella sp.]
MKIILLLPLAFMQVLVFAQVPGEKYPDDSASVYHAGVPKGEVLKFRLEGSKIYPGTWRDYWIYIPAQYHPDQPACVYINQDNIQFKAPIVFDNLINSKEIPVTIGIFVSPGRVSATDSITALDRFNRSFEYDGLGDQYARFILRELLPVVEKQRASDGRSIRLSKNGNDRVIAGSSSGAIAAFTAAWEHPEEFSRVFSCIGTYVGIRGGDRYPTLIRKYEPKAIRIFLQDGNNDQNSYAGDWFKENELMERALQFSGYEVAHVWGEGAHSGGQATSIFPQVIRWLWKDYPKPVNAGTSKNYLLQEIVLPGEGWKPVNNLQRFTGTKQAKATNGYVYVIENQTANHYSKLYLITPKGKKLLCETNSNHFEGLALTPDQSQLYVAEPSSHWIWIYQINADGTLRYKQRYGWLHVPDQAENAGGCAIACDNAGHVYVATRMGVQVMDQIGKVAAMLPLPGNLPATSLYFSGFGFSTINVVCGQKTYSRKLNVRGISPVDSPNKPPIPKL